MPLFRDPDRRRHYLWSPDQDNRELPTTGSPKPQLNELNHRIVDAPNPAGADADYMELSESTELNLPPQSWANGREELIHRIKENSPWRHQNTVCLSCSSIIWVLRIFHKKFTLFSLTFLSYITILTMLTYHIDPG
jgi:hypothetical protein